MDKNSFPSLVNSDTIIAPITPPGRGGVAVVRLSGERVEEILASVLLSETLTKILHRPRSLVLATLYDPRSSVPSAIDKVLVAFLPAPHSFTGEDTAEFNLHGSPYLVQQLVEVCCACGARFARPGEFSERAFLNGKIDLTQAEAIADLIASETEAQAHVAREHFQGKLADAISELGEPLREVLAEIEAHIDFPDEGIEYPNRLHWLKKIESINSSISRYIESYSSGRLYREGVKIAICGLPNAGKSSLLNALLGEERVIVSDIPGTTRDAIEEHISINGLLVRVSDTAGIVSDEDLKHRADEIEQQGVTFSRKRVHAADLVLLVIDPTEPIERQSFFVDELTSAKKRFLILLNKSDLDLNSELLSYWSALDGVGTTKVIDISARTHFGFGALRTAIYESVTVCGSTTTSVMITNERHYQLLVRAREAIASASELLTMYHPPELIAFEIRSALSQLSEIIGITTTEDTLGLIFSRFCIGK